MAASEGRAGAQIAGRYRLIERCRVGAAPETWRAEDPAGAACTVFYYPDAALAEDGARRFLSEAPFVRGVEHARLLPLLDVGVDGTGSIFGVSPLIEGRSVASRAESVGAMPYLEATTVICDALQGLGALHDRDLVHAGITSAEVIVAPDASGVSRGRSNWA